MTDDPYYGQASKEDYLTALQGWADYLNDDDTPELRVPELRRFLLNDLYYGQASKEDYLNAPQSWAGYDTPGVRAILDELMDDYWNHYSWDIWTETFTGTGIHGPGANVDHPELRVRLESVLIRANFTVHPWSDRVFSRVHPNHNPPLVYKGWHP